jgi:hypothetical protein
MWTGVIGYMCGMGKGPTETTQSSGLNYGVGSVTTIYKPHRSINQGYILKSISQAPAKNCEAQKTEKQSNI